MDCEPTYSRFSSTRESSRARYIKLFNRATRQLCFDRHVDRLRAAVDDVLDEISFLKGKGHADSVIQTSWIQELARTGETDDKPSAERKAEVEEFRSWPKHPQEIAEDGQKINGRLILCRSIIPGRKKVSLATSIRQFGWTFGQRSEKDC